MKNTALPNNSPLEKAILTTVLYSDIFHFPLTKEEIWQYLIIKKGVSQEKFAGVLRRLSQEKKKLFYQDGYYCLVGRNSIIAERRKHLPELANKILLAKRAAFYLSYIPTVYFIGISGGVAVGNVKETDDVDLFIITQKKTLFLTRLWILAILEVMQLRRVRNEKNPANKICVNLLLEETALSWPTHRQSLYTAHEIAQLKPLFQRKNMYEKFLTANHWIKNFLPQVMPDVSLLTHRQQRKYATLTLVSLLFRLLPVEIIARSLQKLSINKYRTREIVQNDVLAFHPIDYGARTLRILREKTQLLGLLTKR